MRSMRAWTVIVVGLLGIVSALTAAVPAKEGPVPEAWRKRMSDIAGSYLMYGRVDDEFRWAPSLCRMPNAGRAYYSRSKDEKTHGQKLYSLFARKRSAYVHTLEKGSPVGQIIVKESWSTDTVDLKKHPESEGAVLRNYTKMPIAVPHNQVRQGKFEIEIGKAEFDYFGGGVSRSEDGKKLVFRDHFFPCAVKDGKLYRADKKMGLYIMMKLDPKTAGTDQGWVYATTTADGKKITSIGRLESCMKCHRQAKHDRLFGIK